VWLKAEAFRRGWGEPEWLFPNEVGRPMDEAKVSRVFRLVLERAGLRHTFASLLLAAGAPNTYVAAQLGHANPSTTLRFYARAAAGGDDADVIDSKWSRGRESNPRPTDYESVALPLSYPGSAPSEARRVTLYRAGPVGGSASRRRTGG
jgi:hypothetical protein